MLDDTAVAPDDDAIATGAGPIVAGSLTTTIPVPVIDDMLDESDESFFVERTNLTNAVANDLLGEATMADDDEPAPAPIATLPLPEDRLTGLLRLGAGVAAARGSAIRARTPG